MSANDEITMLDDQVICLDSSQDSGEDNDSLTQPINLEKTLPPGVAPEGFIVLDESQEEIDDKTENSTTNDESLPLFKVIFRNEATVRTYRKQVENFFHDLVSATFQDDTSNELILDVWGADAKDEIEIMDHTLFKIDNTPGSLDDLNIPAYGIKYDKVLKARADVPEASKQDTVQPRVTCFNCLGGHTVRDCPSPRNQYEINKNRQAFSSKATSGKLVRYHLDEAKFQPGVLSAELREALGLGPSDLPRHIIKMRKLGYPPGWLEEARLEHSGIVMYGHDGQGGSDNSELLAEDDMAQYDPNKIHDFPGFNVPAPDGTRDAYWNEHEKLRHSKDTMLGQMSSKTPDGYRKKKLKKSLDQELNNANSPAEVTDEKMDDSVAESEPVNGHFVPPLPPTEPLATPPIVEDDVNVASPLRKDALDTLCRGESPSLTELENKKKLLLAELDDSSLLSNPGTPTRPASGFETPKMRANCSSTPLASSCGESTPKIGSITSVELGTPILESTSVYTKLPDSDKFSKDICDVINFENLPGATGKYEKLSNLLNKVRETLSYADD